MASERMSDNNCSYALEVITAVLATYLKRYLQEILTQLFAMV